MSALRLLVRGGRVIRGRPLAPIAGLGARVTRRRAYALWPSADTPIVGVDLSAPAVARWIRATFEPDARGTRVQPVTWNAMRAGAIVWGGEPGLAEAAPGGEDHSFALWSPSGAATTKATCFAFPRGADAPTRVVKAMADPRFDERLRREYDVLAAVRAQLPSDGALPDPPLFTGQIDGSHVAVEAFDSRASGTGAATREQAFEWLRSFRRATTTATAPWGDADTERAVTHLPDAADARRQLAELNGLAVPRCASHGDFWRGNVAFADGALRVFDWEWAQLDARPFLDVWSWEIADLLDGRAADLNAALIRVEDELRRDAIDPRFARATLAPSIAELGFRSREATGAPGPAEERARVLLGLAAQLN